MGVALGTVALLAIGLRLYVAAEKDPFRLREIDAMQHILASPGRDFASGSEKRAALERLVELRVALDRADLRGADLGDAVLERASLAGARMNGADLRDADLGGASLIGTDLHGADLRGASLYKSNLYKADLSRADLREADLRLANLSGAWLAGARLGAADLRRSQALRCPQLLQASEWWTAHRSRELACGRRIPDPPPHH